MAERFKKIWHDPVWSKVISGLILALLVLLRDLWSKSGYSINMKVAWSAAIDALASAPGAVRAWLTEPVYMPRGSALVLVVIVVLLEVWLIIRLGRRAANQIQQFRRAGIVLNAELEKVKLAKTELAAQLEQARLAGADSAVELAKAQGEITELKRLVTAAQLAKP